MNFVKIEKQERIGYIILSRAEKRNALNDVFISELKRAFGTLAVDSSVKVVILKAEGEVFSAGADLEYLQRMQGFSFEENLADSNNLKELFLTIQTLPKIVICLAQGHAIAGGCGLASVCDFCFAVPEAKFGYTEVKIGFIPALVMVILLRKLNCGKAKELLLTGKLITAEEAATIGLINGVIQAEEIEEYVMSFAQNIIEEASSQSLATTKEMMNAIVSMNLTESMGYAAKMNAHARTSDDCKRGIDAFLKKEKIVW
jgi:methylglutaconyl-CoA hydratase